MSAGDDPISENNPEHGSPVSAACRSNDQEIRSFSCVTRERSFVDVRLAQLPAWR